MLGWNSSRGLRIWCFIVMRCFILCYRGRLPPTNSSQMFELHSGNYWGSLDGIRCIGRNFGSRLQVNSKLLLFLFIMELCFSGITVFSYYKLTGTITYVSYSKVEDGLACALNYTARCFTDKERGVHQHRINGAMQVFGDLCSPGTFRESILTILLYQFVLTVIKIKLFNSYCYWVHLFFHVFNIS